MINAFQTTLSGVFDVEIVRRRIDIIINIKIIIIIIIIVIINIKIIIIIVIIIVYVVATYLKVYSLLFFYNFVTYCVVCLLLVLTLMERRF